MKILLVGPQGSGKTTQATYISQKSNLCMVIIGNMLRERALADDAIGLQIREDQKNGVLVEDQTVATILKEKLASPDCQNGFVVDGWPRTMAQLNLFDPGYDLVINLEVDEDVAVDRLVKRGRHDDTPEAIHKRLSIYFSETKQVLDEYKKRGIVTEVDGNLSVDEVSQKIEAILDQKTT